MNSSYSSVCHPPPSMVGTRESTLGALNVPGGPSSSSMPAAVRYVGVFWDIGNVAVPRDVDVPAMVDTLRSSFIPASSGFVEKTFVAIGDMTTISQAVRTKFHEAKVKLIHNEWDAFAALSEEMESFVLDVKKGQGHPPPEPRVVLLSTNDGFSDVLGKLRWGQGAEVCLVYGGPSLNCKLIHFANQSHPFHQFFGRTLSSPPSSADPGPVLGSNGAVGNGYDASMSNGSHDGGFSPQQPSQKPKSESHATAPPAGEVAHEVEEAPSSASSCAPSSAFSGLPVSKAQFELLTYLKSRVGRRLWEANNKLETKRARRRKLLYGAVNLLNQKRRMRGLPDVIPHYDKSTDHFSVSGMGGFFCAS